MKKRKTLEPVRAADGRLVHFPLDVMASPGRRTAVLQGDGYDCPHCDGDDDACQCRTHMTGVVEVPRGHRFVVSRKRAGDLIGVAKPRKRGDTESKPSAAKATKPSAE